MGGGQVVALIVLLQLRQHFHHVLDLAGHPVAGSLACQSRQQHEQEVVKVVNLLISDVAHPCAPARLQLDQVLLFQHAKGLPK